MSKVIRVQKKTYRGLAVLAGNLQAEFGFFVSIDDAIGVLLAKNNKKLRVFKKNLRKNKR